MTIVRNIPYGSRVYSIKKLIEWNSQKGIYSLSKETEIYEHHYTKYIECLHASGDFIFPEKIKLKLKEKLKKFSPKILNEAI